MSVRIHPTALVSADAQIGENVEIGAFAIIGPECVDRRRVRDRAARDAREARDAGVEREGRERLDRGRRSTGSEVPGERTYVEIGEGTVIREFATINRGTAHSERTVVGKNCLIMSYVHLAHDCQVGDHVIISNGIADRRTRHPRGPRHDLGAGHDPSVREARRARVRGRLVAR